MADYVMAPSVTLAAAQRAVAAALEGRTIGAIGVSGGSPEQDIKVAEAGAAVVA